MRKGFKLAALTSAMIMASGSAFALGQGAGFGFSKWDSNNGAITHGCETGGADFTGYTCETIANGDGFKQLMITNPNGDTYIGTFVTDPNATGSAGTTTGGLGFADESYVKMVFSTGGQVQQQENGISALQKLTENGTDGTVFSSRTEIETADATAQVPILINQSLKNTGTDANSAGDDFMSSFIYAASLDADGARDGFQMQLDQIAGLGANGGKANDVQNFSLRERAGTMLATGSTINMPGGVDPNNVVNGVPASKESLTYSAEDDIKMVWLGQRVDLTTQVGTQPPSNQMGSLFGYLSFENKGAFANPTPTSDVMARFSLLDVSTGTGADAWGWDNQFALDFGDPSGTLQSGAPVMTETVNDPSGGLVSFP